MSHFLKQKRYISLLSFLVVFSIYLFCSPKENPVTTPPDVPIEVKTPTLSIISPAQDTIVDNTTDSIALKAVFSNSAFIDTLKINGIPIAPTLIVSDTLITKIALPTDTFKVILTIIYEQTKTIHDTLTISKKAAVVTKTGMAKITGTLLQESSGTLAKRLAKSLVAHNAQGVKSTVNNVIPISGADIMVYNSETLSTSSDTTVQTDSLGKWSVELDPANYFVFAVYFDRTNLEIVTTALPDIKAEKDKVTETDSAVAVSDDIRPILTSVLDAGEVSGDNIFLPTAIPSGLPIVMSFSEPMTRVSIGDSIHGVVIGPVDADSSGLPLLDTIPVKKLWGPSGKELRLIPTAPLTAGSTYKVVIPTTSKDLALNKLDNDYYAIIEVTTALALPDFALKSTVPLSGDTIQAGMSIECFFTRPVDGISLNKNTAFSDTNTSGFFEVKGNIARFINKKPFIPGSQYTLLIKNGVKDLLGDSLAKDTSITFYTQPKDTFEQKLGIEGLVASSVKKFMGAIVIGDLESFAQSFHPSFEFIETDGSGTSTRTQLAPFLTMMRTDIDRSNRLSKHGIIAPVFYYPKVNGERLIAWKLKKDTTELYFEDMMGQAGGIGRIPRVITMDTTDITNSVTYINRGIIYNGDTLYFAPDMSRAYLDDDTRENDPLIFGKLLRDGTDVETQEVMLSQKQSYILRNLQAKEGNDTAKVVIELTTEEHFLDGKRPGPIMDPTNPPPLFEKRVEAIQTKLLFTAGKWLVVQMAVKNIFEGDRNEFKQENIKNEEFVIQNFEQTRPVNFVHPTHKSVAVSSPIILKWDVPKKDGIGSYLVAIANELSGGNQGLLIFTRNDSIVLNVNGSVESGTILSIDPRTIHVPIPHFNAKLSSFAVSDSDVYVWKVIALPDTSMTTVAQGGMLQVIADSDFGNHGGGLGIFTLMATMPDISATLTQVMPGPGFNEDRFADRDGDFYPDWVERAFGTSPDDPGSTPNFSLDTDLDGFPDFIELLSGSNPEDAASKPADTDPQDNIPDMLQKRPEWRPELAEDTDKDGFPNEIEMLFGTDPWRAESKPSKSIKASVPTNTYFGGIKLGDQEWKKINFSLLSDSTGDFALIETTELQGIARNGVNLSVKLVWANGEWVFFLRLVNGPNTGKFIKVRFHNDGNNLRGPVDLADMENGGGPYIGEFFASLDTINDFNDLGGHNNNILINNNIDGPLNLGPPPMDRIKRPDSGSVDMKLSLLFDANGVPQLTMKIKDGDSITVPHAFWNPMQMPSIGFHLPDSPKQYHLDGSLHRIGRPDGGNDTLVLIGMIDFNVEDANGGSFREHYDYVVFNSNFGDDPKVPSGTWDGWYTKPMGPVNQGPLPYIGTSDSVMAALARTDSTAVILGAKSIVKITSVMQDQNIWLATVDTSKYFIMEKMGDFASVMVIEIEGKLHIALSNNGPGGSGTTNPPPMGIRYKGDSLTIASALTASGNDVKVNAPTPFIIKVDPATLKREPIPNGTGNFEWVAYDAADPQRKCIFLGIDSDPNQPRIEENMPVVDEMKQHPPQDGPPMLYVGDSVSIVTALSASVNTIQVKAADPFTVTVDPASLRKVSPLDDPSKFQWMISDASNAQKKFMFIASDINTQLRIEGNMPVAIEHNQQPPVDHIPFSGDSAIIPQALTLSNNRVILEGALDSASAQIDVDPSSLKKMVDQENPSKFGYAVNRVGVATEIFIFMGRPQNPAELVLKGTTPVVFKAEMGPPANN